MADAQLSNARQELTTLRTDITNQLKSKNDTTLSNAAKSTGHTFVPIRTPPSQIKIRRTLKGHFGKVTAIHWGGDSKLLVSASQDGNLLVWNAAINNKLQAIALKSSYVMSVGIEQSAGNLIACGGLDNLCTIYRRDTANYGTPVTEMATHDGFISCCRFLSSNEVITSSADSTIIQWDISRSQPVNMFAEHTADVMYIAMQPNNTKTIFASCSVDKTCKLWDIRTPKASVHSLCNFHTSDINAIDFIPCDGNVFGTCSQDGTVRLFDIRCLNELACFVSPATPSNSSGNQDSGYMNTNGANNNNNNNSNNRGTNNDDDIGMDGYTSIAFSKSGRVVFAGHTNGSIHAYDTIQTKETPTFTLNNAHDRTVSDIGISPCGDALCTAGWDGTIKVWA